MVDVDTIKEVRAVDLLTYLRVREPGELVQGKGKEIRTVSHGSLVISNGLWFWHKGGVGGRSAVDYLIKVRGLRFLDAVDAVRGLAGGYLPQPITANTPIRAPDKPKELILPRPAKFPTNALAYLQKRGISPDIVRRCLENGILYEGRFNGSAVCVFVGKDGDGKPRFACMRGIDGDLKRDCFGSDKRYSFCYYHGNADGKAVSVYEAPIDALSGASLAKRSGGEDSCFHLSLGGTAPNALLAFLESHTEIEQVTLCLDNDDAGRCGSDKIAQLLAANERFSHIEVKFSPPPDGFKDYNELLVAAIRVERERKSRSGKAELFI